MPIAAHSLKSFCLCAVGAALSFTAICLPAPAQAEDFIMHNGRPLERVRPWTSRPKFYIEDPNPELIDHRRPKTAAPNYVFNIPPLPEAAPQGTVVLNPTGSNLSPSGFQSNIPPGGFSKPALSPVKPHELAPVDRIAQNKFSPARPVGLTGKSKTATQARLTTPTAYMPYDKTGYTGSEFSSKQKSNAQVYGEIKTKANRSLLGK